MNNNTKYRNRENHKARSQNKPLPYPPQPTWFTPAGYTRFEITKHGKVGPKK